MYFLVSVWDQVNCPKVAIKNFPLEHLSPKMLVCGSEPEQGDVLAWNLLQVAERRGLACEAVVGVVIGHDGGGADLAQLVLWALQTPPYSMQVVLPAVPHCRQKQNQTINVVTFTSELLEKSKPGLSLGAQSCRGSLWSARVGALTQGEIKPRHRDTGGYQANLTSNTLQKHKMLPSCFV